MACKGIPGGGYSDSNVKSTDWGNTNWSDLNKVNEQDNEKKKDFRDKPPVFNVSNPSNAVAYNQNYGGAEGGIQTKTDGVMNRLG